MTQRLQNKKCEYDHVAQQELYRFRKAKNCCEQVMNQGITRLKNKILDIDVRQRNNTAWLREQKEFWHLEKTTQERWLNVWNKLSSELLKRFAELETLWKNISFNWNIRG